MKLGVSLAIVVALLLATFYARPLLALRDLKRALESRDEAAVEALVDFPKLRAAVLAHAHAKIQTANSGAVLAGARDFVEDKLADFKIESLATPIGLIHLVCDQNEDGRVDDAPKPPGTPCHLNGKVVGFHYVAWTRFDVLVHRAKGGDMTLTMGKVPAPGERQPGTPSRWRLVDLIGK